MKIILLRSLSNTFMLGDDVDVLYRFFTLSTGTIYQHYYIIKNYFLDQIIKNSCHSEMNFGTFFNLTYKLIYKEINIYKSNELYK